MPTDPNTLPPVPRGSLMEWMARRPDEVRAYLDAVRSITRAPGLQRARENSILPSRTTVQSLPAPAPEPPADTTLRYPRIDWTARSIYSEQWKDVAWSPSLGLFCGISGSRAAYSADGATWTAVTLPNTATWQGITWAEGLGLFVVVGASNGGGMLTSPDAINWTRHTPHPGNNFQRVIWVAELGLLVAVADSGTTANRRVATSPDGVVWTLRTTPHDGTWVDLAWSPTLRLLMAVNSTGSIHQKIMVSADGINWELRPGPNTEQLRTVVWHSPTQSFWTIAQSGTYALARSADAYAWTEYHNPVGSAWRQIRYAETLGMFAAVAWSGNGHRTMCSLDGERWFASLVPENNEWAALAYSPQLNIWVALANNGTNRAMSGVPSIMTVDV